MIRISLFKTVTAVVIFLTFSFQTAVADEASDKRDCEASEGEWKVEYNDKNERRTRCDRSRAQKLADDCVALQKDIATSTGSFMASCKEEFQADARNAAKKSSAIKACQEDFDECRNLSDDEMPFMSMIGSATGMSLPNLSAGGVKKCSKFNEDKHQSMIEKMQTRLDTKNKDHKEAIEKANKDEESYQDKAGKLQEDFIKDQEKRAEDVFKSKEDKRDKDAAITKQKLEYAAKMRDINKEIFKLQQQQSLMTAQRGSEVNGYKLAVIKCKKDVRDAKKSLESNTMGSLRGAAGKGGSNQSDIAAMWEACTNHALRNRMAEAEKYKVAMDSISNEIFNKMQDLEDLRKSLQKLEQMFAMSEQEALQKDQQDEANFAKKQYQKYQQVLALDSQMQKKRMENQRAIAEAKNAVTTASNKLSMMEAEEPLGDKSLQEVRREASKAYGLQETFEQMKCDQRIKNLDGRPGSASGSR